MPSELTTQSQVTIDAPPHAVWRALTEPELIRRWFFGVETETDWSVGGPIVHRGGYQGRPYEDRGTVVRFEPERVLTHTHWSSTSGLPDEPEHYQEVTWSLRGRDGGTELTVSEVNLPSEAARAVSEQGWRAALGALKALLEHD